jgi:hypothetical protein
MTRISDEATSGPEEFDQVRRTHSPLLLKYVNEIIAAERGLQAGLVDDAAYQLARSGHATAEIEHALLSAAQQLGRDDGIDRVLEMIRDAIADGSRDRVGAALELAAAAIPIFPATVVQNGNSWKKRPLIDGWQQKATTDLAQLQAWWSEHPSAVPAIWCGHPDLRFIVLDADRHPANADGVQALADLNKQHGAFDPHPVTQTAGGGFHHIFRQPSGIELGNETGDLPKGIDIRGKGGFIVAPGAVRPDGKEWKPYPRSPLLSEALQANSIPEVPGWLVQLVRPATCARGREAPSDPADEHAKQKAGGDDASSRRGHRYAEAALHNQANKLRGTKPGGRNNRLYKCAFHMGTMVARGWISSTAVSSSLLGACEDNGLITEDGRPSVETTFNSGLQGGLKNPHGDLSGTNANGKPPPDWYYPRLLSELRALYRLRLGPVPGRPEIDDEIWKATDGRLNDLDARTVSQIVGFSFAEYKVLGNEASGRRKPRHPSLLRPVDAIDDKIRKYLAEFHGPRKKEAERRRRAHGRKIREAAAAAPSRAEAILMVIGVKFMTIAEIMEALKPSAAFKRKDGKGYLSGNSLRQAILREIGRSPLVDQLVTKQDVHPHGLKQLLVRRK